MVQGAAWWPNPNSFRPRMMYLNNAEQVIITNVTFINRWIEQVLLFE